MQKRSWSALVVAMAMAACGRPHVTPSTPMPSRAAEAPEAINDPESYAVYDAVLAGYYGDKSVASVAVLDRTHRGIRCGSRVPNSREFGTNLDALFTSFATANTRQYDLLRGLFTPEASVISEAAVDATARSRPPNEKLLSFSAVGFDQAKTWALVSVVNETNGIMAEDGYSTLLHKSADRWAMVQDSVMCLWIE